MFPQNNAGITRVSQVGYAPRTFLGPDYRRCYVPGGLYFFTVVTERRAGILANDLGRDCLRNAIRHCQQHLSFRVDALVMLPDHIHTIWTLPPDDCDYSKRWGIIKKHFTQTWLSWGGTEQSVTASRLRYRRRGIWQRHFGSMLCATNAITKPTSITCISIR